MKLMELLEKNWFQRISLHITIAAALMILYISYLLLWPIDPLTVTQPHHVLTPVVQQGTTLAYEVEYCSKFPVSFVVHRQLLNLDTGDLWMIPDRLNTIGQNCLHEKHEVLTPLRADLGKYKLIAEIQIQINPLREKTYHFESETFEIVPPEVNLKGIIK